MIELGQCIGSEHFGNQRPTNYDTRLCELVPSGNVQKYLSSMSLLTGCCLLIKLINLFSLLQYFSSSNKFFYQTTDSMQLLKI